MKCDHHMTGGSVWTFAAITAAALASAAMVPAAHATNVSVISTKDNTLFEDPTGSTSNGAGPYFFAGATTTSGLRRGLIQFDLQSVVPAGATVNSVTLQLNLNKTISVFPVSIDLHRSLADWGEGTSNSGAFSGGAGAAATPGDATWLNTFYNTGTWSTPGGDFASGISASASIPALGTFTVASTPQLVADVQGWVNSPSSNFGWFVLSDEATPGGALRFDTRETTTPGAQPMLSIDFTAAVPQVSTWKNDADGNWSDGDSWSGPVPNAVDATANFGPAITSSRTVTVDSPQTVGSINFSSPISYTIAGTSTLTLDRSAGQVAITVTSGSHTIEAPIVLNDSISINVAAGQMLSVQHIRRADGTTAGLNLDSGKLRLLPSATANSPQGTSVVALVSVSPGGQMDLTNNSLVIDYNPNAGSFVDEVRSMLHGNSLTSSMADSTHRIGYLDNATRGLTSFSGQSVDPSSILIKFTYGGDANLDGQVDVTDLGALATNWQTSNVWSGGDFNYDGFVDVTDLGILATDWQLGVGSPLGPGSLQAALETVGLGNVSVPEPASIGALGICAIAATLRVARRSAKRRATRRVG